MAIEAHVTAAAASEETTPMSPGLIESAIAPAAATAPAARRGWLRRMVPREYLPRSRRWKPTAAAASPAAGGSPGASAGSRLVSTLSRSLRWKRLPGFSLTLRSGSATAVLDAVAFRVMYVLEAVVLGLALSCFFLCCGCQL